MVPNQADKTKIWEFMKSCRLLVPVLSDSSCLQDCPQLTLTDLQILSKVKRV